MSADNMLLIVEEEGRFTGYQCFATILDGTKWSRYCAKCVGTLVFQATTLEDAVNKAEEFWDTEGLEYGYRFISRSSWFAPIVKGGEQCSNCFYNK